jgi:hypothetical protein
MISGVFPENEMILLCSDGLTTEVGDDGIAAILSRETSPQKAADRLVEAAISSGGSDNITVIIVAAPERSGDTADHRDDTDSFDIPEATTVDYDNERTEIDEPEIPPDRGAQGYDDDSEITIKEENFLLHRPAPPQPSGLKQDQQAETVPGGSTVKTVCYAVFTLAALTAIAIGLVYLP